MSEKPCPSCGYCPTCGRQNFAPTYPWWIRPNSWPYRWWTTTGTTSQPTTSSGGAPPNTTSSACSH